MWPLAWVTAVGSWLAILHRGCVAYHRSHTASPIAATCGAATALLHCSEVHPISNRHVDNQASEEQQPSVEQVVDVSAPQAAEEALAKTSKMLAAFAAKKGIVLSNRLVALSSGLSHFATRNRGTNIGTARPRIPGIRS